MTAIPRLNAAALVDADHSDHARELHALARAATEVGFFTLCDTPISGTELADLIAAYRAFFSQPEPQKAQIDMARTGANRGWGGVAVRTGRSRRQPRLQGGVRLRL
tara:strand:- start:91 stop:408 length:318 start_codon:yes stop_codon:yes gene_type:complete